MEDIGIPEEIAFRFNSRFLEIAAPTSKDYRAAYKNTRHAESRIVVLGVKTTCKDRWRQVLNEATRVKRKHILTLQPGISYNQLLEMKKANVCLIVPEKLHAEYPTDTGIELLTIEEFFRNTKTLLATP